MKKRFTRIMAAMMLLVTFALPMGMRGQTRASETFSYTVYTGQGTSGSGSECTATQNGVTIASTKAYGADAHVREYSGSDITISGPTITKIEITCTASGTSNNGPSKLGLPTGGAGSYSYSGYVGTWTGSASSITLHANAQARWTQIVVTYSSGGTTPTYTVTYDCNGGTSGCPENQTGITAGTSITLAAAPTKTDYAFNGWNDGTTTYQAGASYTVNGNVTMTAQWQLDVDYLFYESFNTNDGTGGNDNQWSGSIASNTLTADNTGWTFANGSGANKCAKFGTGSKKGSAQTPAISHTGNATLTFKAAAWNGSSESTTLKLSATSGTLSASTVTLVKGEWTDYTINITGITTSTQITFEGNANSNNRFFLDEVMVVEVAPSTDPSITASNVDITYNATSGSIAYTIENEPTTAGTLSASTTANWLTLGTVTATTVPFTCTANTEGTARTATVTLTYTYGNNETVTQTVTITQAAAPVIYTTIPALFEAATSTETSVFVTFNNWVVSGVSTNGKSVYVTDNSGNGFIIYFTSDMSGTFAAGDILSGTAVACKLKLYNGAAELVNLNASDLTITDGGNVSIVDIAMASLSGVNTGALVHYDNLTCSLENSKYYLTDGTTTLQAYNTLYAFDEFEDGKTYNVTGLYVQYNSTKEIAPRSTSDIEEVVVTTPVINAENVSIAYDATSGEIAYTITNPVDGQNLTATTTADWITIGTVGSTSVPFTCSTNEGDSDRTATITLSYNGAEDKEITVTQDHYVAPITGNKYVKVTSTTDLISGQYLIVYEDGKVAFDGSLETLDAASNTIEVSISNNEIAVNTTTAASEFTIDVTAGTIKSASGYYIGRTANSNGMNSSKSEAYTNTISFDENYNAVITSSAEPTLRFNDASNQNRFRYYASGQKAIQLYKKVEPIDLPISAWTTTTGGYHLIASPIMETVLPTAVTNMIDATATNYDLYRFNQNEDYEWQNYKHHTEGFVIEPGKAYLYAHNTDVTLTFNGTAYNGNGTFNLTQSTTNTSNGGKMNALGNPYNAPASIGSRSFYKMNADGTALEAVVGGTIGALEGIVVNYDANNPTVTFSTSKSRDVIELLTLNLQEQDNVIDNVIVRFDGGDQLLKYQIFDSSKIYVTVDGEDYAVVRGENQGTLPVNFMALSNGTYTISMDFENMTFSYLHLIDNLTGEDIDMLTTTSYSFDATTEDDVNRFTLVYSKDGEGTTETLTFYDGDTSSSYVPVYGFYADAYQKVEFIMPAEDLYALTGATINKMTWYLTTPAEVAWGGNFKIYLMETEATTPANYADLTNATLVYDGPLDGTGETLEINFATGFLYEGDNLLVAVHQTETGTYKSATFAGSAVTGAALQGYSYNNLDQVNQAVRDFLPKTTFEFTPGSGAIYYKPKQLQASEIGITSAVLTWEAGDDETSWGVEYKKVTEDTWTDAGTVDQLTITLDNLEAGTEYEAHVKSIYTDGESGWTTIAFATEACEETDKGEVAYSLTDTYGDGWNNNKLRIFLSGTDIMIAELTLTTGSELEGVVKLCYDTDYDLVWVAGNYAYETGFVLTAPDGTIIYEYHGTGNSGGTTPTPGVLTTFQIHNGFTKTIEAYTENSGYYLIASPVGNVLASNVTNMVDGNYDLYMFDQTGDDEGKQWLNYKASAFSYLEVGMGYLYASESDVTLTFSGTPISSDDDYAVEVNYNASSDFPGLNLLGNPFADEAYLVNAEGNGLAYHRLNPANNTYVTVDDNSAIPMMEGVFYEAGENDVVVYFSATAPATSKSNLNITVSQGRGMVDNAIVRFGEGNTLRKISLRDNSTKVYIPQNGSEYALVNANEFGEMPVNFKAESNGTYTMSFSNQNVEFGYLHLIDNLTGADVDLLANPSYSFEAKVSDYASRFKLVFATGNDDSSSDFAFVSNDEIIVNGEGMFQVIDMTGRIISTSQVNGMSSIKLNAASGVYVLRLNDKTQKIVIR